MGAETSVCLLPVLAAGAYTRKRSTVCFLAWYWAVFTESRAFWMLGINWRGIRVSANCVPALSRRVLRTRGIKWKFQVRANWKKHVNLYISPQVLEKLAENEVLSVGRSIRNSRDIENERKKTFYQDIFQ